MASVVDILAGRAYIELDLKTVGTWGKKIQNMANRLRSAAMQMGTAAIIMATPFVAGAKVFAEFSKQMAFVATMLDKPRAHMGKFTEGIRKLSVEFGESTTTLARGLYDILSAGFAASGALDMLRTTTIAAKAGMADAASATQAIIAVMNAYGLGVENAQKVSDILFTTVRYGVLTFGELAGHIGLVASTAAQAGVSMEDMGAVLAVITRGGVETSHAVVALNNILKAFLMPTGAGADFAKKLQEAGLNFEMSAKGLAKVGLIGAFKKISGLSTAHLARLFPTIRAARGVFAMKAGWESLLKIQEKFLDITGATKRAMDEIQKSFGFLVDRVKQASLLILSYVGEAMAGSLTKVGEKIINAARGTGLWIKRNRELITGTARLIATLATLAVVLLVVAKALAIVATISIVISGPYGLIKLAVGIAAGIAAWAALAKVIGKVKDELQELQNLGTQAADIVPRVQAEVAVGPATQEFNRLNELLKANKKARDEIIYGPDYDLEDAKAVSWKEEVFGLTPDEKLQRELRIKGVEQQIRIRDRLLSQLNSEGKMLRSYIDAIKHRVGDEKQVAYWMEQQAKQAGKQLDAIRKIAGLGRMGFFLGYTHTPVLAWAGGVQGVSDEVSLLKEIEANTKSLKVDGEGNLADAIANKLKPGME